MATKAVTTNTTRLTAFARRVAGSPATTVTLSVLSLFTVAFGLGVVALMWVVGIDAYTSGAISPDRLTVLIPVSAVNLTASGLFHAFCVRPLIDDIRTRRAA